MVNKLKTGMVRKIDELGRIVIPKEIRNTLRLNMGDVVEILVEDNKVILKRFSTLLGMEEELFNICKVINEFTNCSILFVDNEKIIVSYGKLSQIYIDQEINPSIYNKIHANSINKTNECYIISSYLEQRQTLIIPLIVKSNVVGLFILFENEKVIAREEYEIINAFRKFIVKNLES